MHLGRAVVAAAASIAARQQIGQVIPESYCKPQCPQCKDAVTDPFDYATACEPNSTFLVNCGSCQTCIWTYAIENPDLPDMQYPENGVQALLDLCLNTTANDEVAALQSQVSRISQLGNALTSGHTPTTTYSEFTMTKTGASGVYTVTAVANPSWTTILSTATWASYYYSAKSQESSASAAAASHNQTAGLASTITAAAVAPTSTPPTDTTIQPLSKSWIIGPVIGSILGIVTVIVVIIFTRRKHRLDAAAIKAARDIKEEDHHEDDDSGESTQGKAQLHAESVLMEELGSTEVYELAAPEPVGSELNTPRDGNMDPIDEWPLPLSPLPLLFAMTELRDERAGNNNSPKHDTYYHS